MKIQKVCTLKHVFSSFLSFIGRVLFIESCCCLFMLSFPLQHMKIKLCSYMNKFHRKKFGATDFVVGKMQAFFLANGTCKILFLP